MHVDTSVTESQSLHQLMETFFSIMSLAIQSIPTYTSTVSYNSAIAFFNTDVGIVILSQLGLSLCHFFSKCSQIHIPVIFPCIFLEPGLLYFTRYA